MRNKGSLTIEAIISFTVFISFMFMLLSVVKFALTDLTLSYAASETAKQLAIASYPIQMINNWEDDYDEQMEPYTGTTGAVNLQSELKKTVNSTVLDIFSKGCQGALSGGLNNIISIFSNYSEAGLWSFFHKYIFEAKTGAKNFIAASIFNSCIENSYVNIDKNKLMLLVELPQSNYDVAHSHNVDSYADMGLEPGVNFMQDDVVVGAKYQYKLVLPFFPAINMNIREVAVEHAWIHGGNGTVTDDKEGIDISQLNLTDPFEIRECKIVYIGERKTGHCYHLKDCWTLKQYGGSKILLKDAIARGYRPCKCCHPPKNEVTN